jgi:hypothetical protein
LAGFRLLPLVFRFFFFVLDEALFVFLVFIGLFGRLQLQRFRADYFQRRAALIAANGFTFVDILFIYVDLSVANGTFHHEESSKTLLTYLYTTPSDFGKSRLLRRLPRKTAARRHGNNSLQPKIEK